MGFEIILVGAGGFLGAMSRYAVSGMIPKIKEIPTGTMTVNVIGSFILAILTFTAVEGTTRYFMSIGMLGSFTTFSTFAYESFRLLEERESMYFLLNIGLNAVICLAAVAMAAILVR